MSASVEFCFRYIVVLAIANCVSNAQFNFRGSFYQTPRNIASGTNNRRFGDNHYGNRISTESNAQPASVKFSYSDDYKSVGDYCYGNSFVGVCTLPSKCPEVFQNIQSGKNPVVCSYQIYEAIVCCPIRNKEHNFNQNPQQGGSTNLNTVNRVYAIQKPKKFFEQNQTPLNNRKVHLKRRQSKQKCDEYSKLASRSASFTSLSSSATNQKVNIPKCSHSTGLIVGGDVAKTGEFPHMAAVGWTLNGEIDWKCGGSLVSEYFVLTAAHCSSFYGIAPNIVRLGEQNLVRQDDQAQPRDYQIAYVGVHPNYTHSSKYYDIALIKLSRQVTFTRMIRPACLWQNNEINLTKVIATGWGQLDFAGGRSNDLRKVTLNIIDNKHCQQLYESSKKLRNGIVSAQLCAGHLEGGKDTCQGDSGGPIQVVTPKSKCVFHIVGITSFGKPCASVNAAAVYTRVSSYVDWIESIVWPQ